MVEYAFTKSKLPRGRSFPIKRTAFDAALHQVESSLLKSVYFTLAKRGTSVILQGHYISESLRQFARAGTASVTVYAVPSESRREAELALLSAGLPRLVSWLVTLQTAGSGPRAMTQYFEASWAQNDLRVRLY